MRSTLPPRFDDGQGMAQVEGWAEQFGGDYELHVAGARVICTSEISDVRRILTLRPSKFKRGLAKVSCPPLSSPSCDPAQTTRASQFGPPSHQQSINCPNYYVFTDGITLYFVYTFPFRGDT